MKTASAKGAFRLRPSTSDGVLVHPEWLQAHLSDPHVQVVEVDVSTAAYDNWHIDGAVLWNIYADLKDADYRLAGTAALERLVARSGIRPDSTVVFYGYAPALRLWLMKLYGHPDVRILDCSRDTWRAGGYPWSTAASEPPAGGFRLGGTCDDGPLGQQSLDDLRRVVEVNLISVMDLCRLAADLLRNASAASVINVASMYGIVASRSPMAAYNATKAALINLTRHLAAVWGQDGVRVNALAPGYFPTELTGFLADPAFAQSIRDHTLLSRTPEPDELDGPLLFLATDASSYMTGQALVIDGGWTAV